MITIGAAIIIAVIALMCGAVFGLLLSGLCLVASRADEHIEEKNTVEDEINRWSAG